MASGGSDDWPKVPDLDEDVEDPEEGVSEWVSKPPPSLATVLGGAVVLLIICVPVLILWLKLVQALWSWSPSI